MSGLECLFILRYRVHVRAHPWEPVGFHEGHVAGRDIETAERVGRRYCLRHGHDFFSIRPGLLADESILKTLGPPSEGASGLEV